MNNDNKTLIKLNTDGWETSAAHGSLFTRDTYVEFTIDHINVTDHSGMVIGISDNLKNQYSQCIGYYSLN
jgi:hypothetical protein